MLGHIEGVAHALREAVTARTVPELMPASAYVYMTKQPLAPKPCSQAKSRNTFNAAGLSIQCLLSVVSAELSCAPRVDAARLSLLRLSKCAGRTIVGL